MPENSNTSSEPGTQPSQDSAPTGPPPGQAKLSRAERVERGLDILSAIMLAVVAVATAWNGYQAARWSSEAGIDYAQASAKRVESTRASGTAGQLTIIDVTIFSNWVNAYATGDERLTRFYEQRFRDEFKPAFDAWVATDPKNNLEAPPSPFAMPEYKLASAERAVQLEQEASDLFQTGKQAIEQSTEYVLNTVFLASVLFFVGIATRFKWTSLRTVILVTALAMLAYGLFNLVVYPKY